MQIKIDLDTETSHRLAESAVANLRPMAWQAYVLLRGALGLPFPMEQSPTDEASRLEEQAATSDS